MRNPLWTKEQLLFMAVKQCIGEFNWNIETCTTLIKDNSTFDDGSFYIISDKGVFSFVLSTDSKVSMGFSNNKLTQVSCSSSDNWSDIGCCIKNLLG